MAKHYIYMKREGMTLVPADAKSEDMLRKVPEGRELMVRTVTARNVKQHRLFWTVAGMVADNSLDFEDAEHVVEQIKYHTGHVIRRAFYLPDAEQWVYKVSPKSIAFQSMPQEEFGEFFRQAVDVITVEYMPGIQPEQIRAEIAEALGVDDWPKARKKK
jgi:hypothetical protein